MSSINIDAHYEPKIDMPERNVVNMLKDKDIREPLFDFLEDTFGKA